MQAIILAAGMGKRLGDFTKDKTKCMVEVSGEKLINRLLDQISRYHLDKIILVVGFKGDDLIAHIGNSYKGITVEYVWNKDFSKTNNIFSLWLARDYLISDDTYLFESDLILDDNIIDAVFSSNLENFALLSRFKSWMDGTVVTIDQDNKILRFVPKKEFNFDQISEYFKTVNIYRFSASFSKNIYLPFLDAYSHVIGKNDYYEQVLKVLLSLEKIELNGLVIDSFDWYEIDNYDDLRNASVLFDSPQKKYEKLKARWGGYWRFPSLVDHSLLVNPHFPTKKFNQELKSNLDLLVSSYPSGREEINALMARVYNVDELYICAANGASELISILRDSFGWTFTVFTPTFEEYIRGNANSRLVDMIWEGGAEMEFPIEQLDEIESTDAYILVSPNNPLGLNMRFSNLERMAKSLKDKNKKLVLDISFADFSDDFDYLYSDLQIFKRLPDNVIFIKSMGKSHGIPGLRLGFLLSKDTKIIKKLNDALPIWNINSIAEFFLQNLEKYKAEYLCSLTKIRQDRESLYTHLSQIIDLKVIKSQANFITFQILNPKYDVHSLAITLLEKQNIFVKVISGKAGMNGLSFIRVSVKSESENLNLVNAIGDFFQG
jgi:histidinol-phosphate/aromatic aminotransferase/cobyric acid decarboxylase-like protein/choline kinase